MPALLLPSPRMDQLCAPMTSSQTYSNARMRDTLLLCCLLLICAGCPEAPIKCRTVSLNFPTLPGESRVTLSAKGNEVQEALAVINDALISNGFIRNTNPPEANVQGFLASYSRRNGEGLVRLCDAPLVWLKADRLEVVFAEGRVSAGQVSAAAKRNADFLGTVLSSRYGKKRVKVQHRSS